MTFVIKTRGAPRPISADFRCPVHGKFTALVDSGADSAPCPAVKCGCGGCGETVAPGHTAFPKPCGLPSPWSPSVIPMRMRRVEATKGKDEAPEHPDWNFQRNLEEGQDPDEYEADREAAAERRRQQLVVDAVRSE
jgi:hypothetical protein